MDEFLRGAGYDGESLALLISAVIALFLFAWAAWQVTAHGKAALDEVQTDHPAATVPLLWKVTRVIVLVVVMLWLLR